MAKELFLNISSISYIVKYLQLKLYVGDLLKIISVGEEVKVGSYMKD